MNARDALAAGGAIVVPNPAPLTHVVTATSPQAVNRLKGRPADQPVALWCHHDETLARVEDAVALDAAAVATGRRLLREELVTLLVPLRPDVPVWLRPAAKDGWALLFGARWEPVAALLGEHPILYVSSANRTGHAPVASAAAARAMFGDDVPVAAGEDREPGVRSATTTVRLHGDGRLELHRPGAQDARFVR
ncbi:Sua5/YciO/YrdC/YwlC family protein [Actinoplanes sp. RD1]|uniref:Sua5/YciO/YrdC/YwlC family protein n=1 Tax=Actinoplanes sp. RD1 TaxID=3064538 RepID=UPI0027428E98|nr:Sua5/YciO/YrdC/YwlC family protein [Actinoplanes sp. RD1]